MARRRFTTASCPTARLTPFRTPVLKPVFPARTWYGPAGRDIALKSPASSVATTRVAPVSEIFDCHGDAVYAGAGRICNPSGNSCRHLAKRGERNRHEGRQRNDERREAQPARPSAGTP